MNSKKRLLTELLETLKYWFSSESPGLTRLDYADLEKVIQAVEYELKNS